ncbi:Exocyst complex component S5 [Emydomyces testavorans]|uniref:Exocyst complex component SEC5 n=1 Tax=Emydomyces testavorans TaxID=2070801 RepID=A0AAF0IGN1_9EURO|nr:Exocyst complex component S5 [Emydomyces testavorans]
MEAQQDVAGHYNLPNAYPEEWPAELDASDESGDEQDTASQEKWRSSGHHGSRRRSTMPLAGKAGAAVQQDEPDPLGSSQSILELLRQRGLAVDDDPRLRSRFLLSSTSFSPALFLTQTRPAASAQLLLQGLSFLTETIELQSASLKVLVESNFEKFVRVKAAIDNVYEEMRDQGPQSDIGLQRSLSQTSRQIGTNFNGDRKNALIEANEYGTRGIDAPLVEALDMAEELWGEALSGRQREEGLKLVLEAVERQRGIYEIGAELQRFIKQRDYDAIVEKYTLARRYANDARLLVERTTSAQKALTDDQVHTILVTGRMWMDAERQIQAFKRDLWRQLSDTQSTKSILATNGQDEEYMDLIAVLLELGVDDNPVWVWLLSRYDYLKTRITTFCERSKAEIEILRRRLASKEKPSPQTVAPYLRLSVREAARNYSEPLDTEPILEFWECIHTFLKKLVSIQGGLLGDIIEFWDTAQSFINGSRQKLLPAGFEGESRKHHRLSAERVNDLNVGIVELVNRIQANVVSLFADPPPENLSYLSAPSSSTPMGSLTPTGSRFNLDPKNIPPPVPKTGQVWEEFAFWPPYANSLSGVHYLSQYLVLIGTAASEMADLSPVSDASDTHDQLRLLVSAARERCVRATCAAWNSDAEHCKYLEDWTRDLERKALTKMPGHFMAFESAALSGIQKILYISEAMTKPGSVDVVTPPPTKLLQMVRSQFVTSVYKALSGLVENAERPVNVDGDDEWVLVGPSAPGTGPNAPTSVFVYGGIDSKNRNVRMLLTLSNLKALRSEHVSQLIASFESAFAVKLAEESKTIQDVLGQIDTRLFQSYTRPIVETLHTTIINGISSPDWVPSTSRPDELRPYVYTTMLTLVMVHTEVSTTLPGSISSTSAMSPSSPIHPLTHAILAELLTQISKSLLEGFMSRPKYSLPALMQATLDTEFIAQTMSQYATEAAGQVQSQIYLELDRRTSNEARAKLQAEFGEMRGVLKRLRERTRGEFACFKKVRSASSK